MQRTILIICFIIQQFCASSQVLTGIVTDSANGLPIPYATVGLMKANAGVNCDSAGRFSIKIPGRGDNKLRISSVGYETRVVSADMQSELYHIKLESKSRNLSEVIVRSRNHSETLEKFNGCGIDHYTSVGHVTQIAKPFHFTNPDFVLDKILICKQGRSCIFRVRIYAIDSATGGPGKDLTDDKIEIRSRKRHVEIDMSNYTVQAMPNDFFVAIEWIYIPGNVLKESRRLVEKTGGLVSYHPLISMKSANQITWQQFFNGRWRKYDKEDFLIAVEVKY